MALYERIRGRRIVGHRDSVSDVREAAIEGASMGLGFSDRPQWGHATGGVEKTQAEGSGCGGKTCFLQWGHAMGGVEEVG